jgi:hypothetical protein
MKTRRHTYLSQGFRHKAFITRLSSQGFHHKAFGLRLAAPHDSSSAFARRVRRTTKTVGVELIGRSVYLGVTPIAR